MCNGCRQFHEQKSGQSGRKPGMNAVSKCEEPWSIEVKETMETRLVQTKIEAIASLNKIGYTSINSSCAKKS